MKICCFKRRKKAVVCPSKKLIAKKMSSNVSGRRQRVEPDRASAVRAPDERALRRLLQLRDQDPPHRAVPLLQPGLPQRLHLPGDPEVCQDPASHEVHAVPEGGDQVGQCCCKSSCFFNR